VSEALHSHQACCPYCGAAIELLVDLSGGSQQYVEDCSTCCRPMECRLEVWTGGYRLELGRDDD
jgi:hypothetical protein